MGNAYYNHNEITSCSENVPEVYFNHAFDKIHGQEKDCYEEVYAHRFQETVCQAIQDHMWKQRGELGGRKRGEHGPESLLGSSWEKWAREDQFRIGYFE